MFLKIMALAIIGKNLDVFGLEDIKFSEPLDFDEIDVKANSDLFSIAEALNVESDEIFRLNPELLRWQTPPHLATYKLRVPPGVKATWDECCKNQDFTAQMYQTYEVTSSKQTYHSVAKHFKIPEEILFNINKAENGDKKQTLKKGTVLLLPFRNGQSIKDPMYADLYDLPRRSILRKKDYRNRIQVAMKKGTKVTDPKEFYLVRKGDTLWDVSNKTGVSLNNIIKSNSEILNMRPIREGDKLVIR
ncbi:MAG: LysM domain-containing protein [Bacteriovoracaceae bacterium]